MASVRFAGIGTEWEIASPDALPAGLADAVVAEVDRFDRTWSRFRDDSVVARVATGGADRSALPADEAAILLDLYDRLGTLTDGGVALHVADRLTALGYGAASAPAGVMDVGAAGKGLLVDVVARLLDEAGVTEYVVDGSGDLFHRGPAPLRVALEDPRDPTKAIGVVHVPSGSALAASATNRRRWTADDGTLRHHVLDARTGEPVDDVIASWAIAPTCAAADAAATALFFTSPALVAPALGAIGARMFPSAAAEYHLDFPGELFLA